MLDGLERLGIRAEAERIGFTKDDYLWLVKQTGERIEYDISGGLAGHAVSGTTSSSGRTSWRRSARRALGRRCPTPRCGSALPYARCRRMPRASRVALEGPASRIPREIGGRRRRRRQRGAQGDRLAVRRDDLARAVRRHQPAPRFRKRRLLAVDDGDRRAWGAVIVKITRDGLWRCTFMEDAALPAEQTSTERCPRPIEHCCRVRAATTLDAGLALQDAPALRRRRFRKGRVMLARRCRARRPTPAAGSA